MMRASSLPPLSRFLFLAIALVALAVLVVGDGAPPAQAQTATVLVSNFGQTAAISNFDLTTTSVVRAQGFATGSDSGGYTLGSIEANIRNAPTAEAQRDTIRAELWSATTAGAPDSIVASLTVPDHPITAGTVKFTAPASTALKASTTYFLLIYTTGNFNLGVTTAVGAAEDSGGAAGWTINDKYHFAGSGSDRNVPSGVTGWNQPAGSPFPIRLRVNSEAADPTDLSALTAESSTDNNTFAALTGAAAMVPAFDADTPGYRATVGNDVSHVRLTPTLAFTSSSVKVGRAGTTLASVASGSASASIALDVGDNAITVRVTATDTTTQDYTVTVRRVPSGTEWYATLVPVTVTSPAAGIGCHQSNPGSECSSQLSGGRSITIGGQSNSFVQITDLDVDFFQVLFPSAPNAALQALNFCVGGNSFSIGSAALAVSESSTDMGWTAGTPVSLSIGTSCAQQVVQSSNANLGGLSASGSATETGTFTPFDLSPAFSATATSYTATVPNATAWAKLTPTVADTGKATVAVGSQGTTLTAVTDTQASAAQALSVGSNNVFTVRVTAEDSTTKDYTVTITRQAQQGDFLVSNMGQTPGTFISTDSIIYMQGFTTGSHSAGYTLASIEAVIEASSVSTSQRATMRAELWSADTSGAPNVKVASLTVPASVATGTVSFAAPASTVLTASTKYFFTLYTTGSFDLKIDFTESDDEDTGSQAGWSISDSPHISLTNTPSGATWTSVTGGDPEDTPALRLRIKGAQGAQSTNANLKSLTARSSRDANTFTALPLSPAFDAAITSYTATVLYSSPYVDLIPTVADTGKATMTLTPPGLPQPDGVSAGTNLVEVGSTVITIRVTAEDGVTTKDYAVTVRRPALTVSLSAAPDPVTEGQSVTIRATLSEAYPSALTIPLNITDVTAEAADHGALANIAIAANALSGTGTIQTNHDSDDIDETFTVALGMLPTPVVAGSHSSVLVTIRDDEGVATVKLSVKPNPSPENSKVSIEAILSKRADSDVSIRLKLLWGQGVENGVVVDYGSLDQGDLPGKLGRAHTTELDGKKYVAFTFPIQIRINSRSQGRTITTYNLAVLGNGATRGEDFTVRLDTGHPEWPASIAAGSPSSVKVRIGESQPRPDGGRPRQGDGGNPWPLSAVKVCWNDETPVGSDDCGPARPTHYGYGIRLPGPASHVTVAPTLAAERSGASLQVGRVTYGTDGHGNVTESVSYSGVSSGSPSGAIALNTDKITTIIRVRVSGNGPLSTITLAVDRPRGGGNGQQGNQGYQGSPGSQDEPAAVTLPTTVTLSLDPDTVGEKGGPATITATLDEPALEGGLSLHLYPSNDSTAVRDVDYTLPASVAIAGGERSGTALVRVTDDDLDEPDERAVIAAYAELFGFILVDSVTLTITDDDTAGITVSAASPLEVDEGDSASYSVVLDSQPTADVVITATSGDGAKVSVFPAAITFTPEAWKQPGVFYVDGLADDDTNDERVAVSHSVTSGDALYRAVIVSTVPVRVSDTTVEQESREQSPQEKYADLIAKIREWRDDPCCASNKAHTDRWDRALLAFGVTVEDTTLSPMTATEAQTYADRGWQRWVEVVEALRELENQAPTVDSAIADATIVSESGTRQVSLSGVFSDADNDSLTITAGSSAETVSTVSVASDYSSLTVSAKGRGTATITVTASDGKGGTVSDAFTVKVKAAPTVSSAISDLTLELGGVQDITLSSVFTDADGDDLTFAATSSDPDVAHPLEFHGTLTIIGGSAGSATITVTAQDSDGNAVSDSFDVSVGADQQQQQQDPPPNQSPTVDSAIGDATIVNESGTRQVSLSGVFDDADNDDLTITAKSSAETVATVSVASDYSSLTVTAQARGTATITVTAKDGNGGTVSDEFTVTVKAAPVVASAISDVSGLKVFAGRDVSLGGVFRDGDGDSLTITAASSDDGIAALIMAADQSKLTVAGVAEGTATITVTARDTDGNTVSDAFGVSVGADQQQQQQQQQDPPPNQAPTVDSAIADATIVSESGSKVESLSGVFSDADNDSLTITAASSDETKATVSVASDYSTLTVSAQARGTATITVTADDGNGGTVSDEFTVTVKAAPVVASSISDVSGLEAGSTQDVSLSGVFRDADGDSLTITAASSDDAKATVSVASDGSPLTLTGVAEGAATITVTARDSDGNTVSDAFDVSVVKAPEPEQDPPPDGETPNRAPTVVKPLADISLEGPPGWGKVSLSGVFHDPDGDELTITVVSSDHGVASFWLEGSTLTVTAMGTGTATITVTAEDPDDNQVSDEFQVTVTPAS